MTCWIVSRNKITSVNKPCGVRWVLLSRYPHQLTSLPSHCAHLEIGYRRFHLHHDVIKWKHFPPYWPFVRGIHRSQRPATRNFDVFFALRLNKRLSKPIVRLVNVGIRSVPDVQMLHLIFVLLTTWLTCSRYIVAQQHEQVFPVAQLQALSDACIMEIPRFRGNLLSE